VHYVSVLFRVGNALSSVLAKSLFEKPFFPITIGREDYWFAIGRPSQWDVKSVVQYETSWGSDARSTGLELSHIYAVVRSPFHKCKSLAIGRYAGAGDAKSCPVRNTPRLLDGFTTSWVKSYLPIIAGMLVGFWFKQCVNHPAIGQPQKVIQPVRLGWWKYRDRSPALQIAGEEVLAGLVDLSVKNPLSIGGPI
jgi:hypothetical protein